MPKAYEEYKSSILCIDDYRKVIEEARTDFKIHPGAGPGFHGDEIPFNLEREYFDALLDSGKIDEARRVVERMETSYKSVTYINLVESYLYRLNTVVRMEALMKERLAEAKKEFNQHTIFIVSIVVGVVTIFGAANSTLRASSFTESFPTFAAISLAIMFVMLLASALNK